SDTVQITINGNSYSKGKDFYFYRGFNDTNFTANSIVFAGYGIDDEKYSDFENINVKNKVVLIIKGEPKKKNKYRLTGNDEPSRWSKNWRNVLETLKQKGAAAVFIVRMDYDLPENQIRISHYMSKPVTVLESNQNSKSQFPPYFYISPRMANDLLFSSGKTIQELQKSIDKKFKPQSFEIENVSVSVKMNRKKEIKTAENILGYIEGTDKKDEVVIITAHYDHIGKHDTVVYNGADDDGSGTVALLEIAAAFKRAKDEGYPIKRSILIMPVSGEEKGLLGSQYYSENPLFPLENTVADINIDMIGRIDEAHKKDTNYVYVIGSDMLSSELHKINEQVNNQYTKLKLDYTYNSK
ncbi:MAG: M28 family peptidase, partial [Bacteroidetes bacterium]